MLLAAVPDSNPDEARGNSGSENEVQKILVFADENLAFRLRMPEYLSVGSLRQPDIEYVLRVATPGFDEAGQRPPVVDYPPGTSRGLQDGVVGLASRVLNCRVDILAFQERIIGENLLEGRTGRQQFQNIRHAHAVSPDARASAALTLFNGDSLQSFWVHGSLLSDCTGFG